MDKKSIFGFLAIFFLIIILFTPKDSNLWITLLISGILFGIIWFFIKEN
ncbi:hypothetical protein KAI04_00930 [Candidatus Pacearchaeota archaeon]|nr:hypothetical protein [Candidatus Pacearchaeota archaeon]